MKIITNNVAFVQKKDIVYLEHTDISIPATVFKRIFENGMVIIDDREECKFERFDEPNEVRFFCQLDSIADYNTLKDFTNTQIIEMINHTSSQREKTAQRFNSLSEDERRKNLNMVTQCELLDLKMYTLRDVLWFKQGYLKMSLPDGIDYPIDSEQKQDDKFLKVKKK